MRTQRMVSKTESRTSLSYQCLSDRARTSDDLIRLPSLLLRHPLLLAHPQNKTITVQSRLLQIIPHLWHHHIRLCLLFVRRNLPAKRKSSHHVLTLPRLQKNRCKRSGRSATRPFEPESPPLLFLRARVCVSVFLQAFFYFIQYCAFSGSNITFNCHNQRHRLFIFVV